MPKYSIAELKNKVGAFPKQDLILAPTPFYRLASLSRALGGPEIYVKREDLTGLAFGGNKSRKLEFIMQDVRNQGADVIVTWGSVQSNWCLQTAASARRFGIQPVLILFKSDDAPPVYDGNLLLDVILGSEIVMRQAEKGKVIKREMVEQEVDAIVARLKNEGHRPYVAPLGGSIVGFSMQKPLGAIGYVSSYVEMMEQAGTLGVEADYVVHSSGSGGTQAGLIVGARALSDKTKILGVSVSDPKATFGAEVMGIVRDTVQALDLEVAPTEKDLIVLDEYRGEGYGIVDAEVSEAVRFVAYTEGIFLDPVYTGRAMCALIDLVKKGFFRKHDTVVFFHTGGTAALFPHRNELMEFLK